ncbi:MAG TPA: ComF family protein [bacterium]|nr:ComF family protein [bacterium]HQL61434.1 ComF family protein [bacterium]
MIGHSIASISRAVLDLLYPPVCPGCGADCSEESDPICSECWHRLIYLRGPFCRTCGHPTTEIHGPALCDNCPVPQPAFDRCRSVVQYCEIMKRIIHAYKFGGRRCLAKPLSRLLFWGCQRYYAGERFDAIVPVPLHSARLREREFNQAAEMLLHLKEKAGFTVEESIVRRIRPTEPQSQMTGMERHTNVAGAFEIVDASKVRGRRFLIVDDVLTTGNTVSEVAQVLKNSGAQFVSVLTVARATANHPS